MVYRVLTLSDTHADRIQFVGTRRIHAEGHRRPRPYFDPLSRPSRCQPSFSIPFSLHPRQSALQRTFHSFPRLYGTLTAASERALKRDKAATVVEAAAAALHADGRPRDRTRKSSTTAAQMNGMPTHAWHSHLIGCRALSRKRGREGERWRRE